MTQTVHFSLNGDFITDLARSWLYEEKRPYNKVMELLLACLHGSKFSESKLEEFKKRLKKELEEYN